MIFTINGCNCHRSGFNSLFTIVGLNFNDLVSQDQDGQIHDDEHC